MRIKTGPRKDFISTLSTELLVTSPLSGSPRVLDEVFKLLLSQRLSTVISAVDWYHEEIMDICNLMSLGKKFNISASDVFWKNVIIQVDLTHGDACWRRPKTTRLQAFGIDWILTQYRAIPARWKEFGEKTREITCAT